MDVIFRIEKDGGIVAVFPYVLWNRYEHTIACYTHYGQHGACTWIWARYDTSPASPDEYKDLLNELYRIGYTDLRVLKRLPSWHTCYEKF